MQFLRNLSAGFHRPPTQNGHVPFWQGMVSDTFTVELAADDIRKLAKLVSTLDDC